MAVLYHPGNWSLGTEVTGGAHYVEGVFSVQSGATVTINAWDGNDPHGNNPSGHQKRDGWRIQTTHLDHEDR